MKSHKSLLTKPSLSNVDVLRKSTNRSANLTQAKLAPVLLDKIDIQAQFIVIATRLTSKPCQTKSETKRKPSVNLCPNLPQT